MEKQAKKFFRNLSETKQVWIPLLVIFIVLAPVLAFVSALGSTSGYIFVDMALSVLLSICTIYAVYRVTEISPEDRFSQLISLWIVFLVVAIIAILISYILQQVSPGNPSSLSSGLALQDLSLMVYMIIFCIVFLFLILLFYLIISFNFDTFFPFVCLLLILGVYLVYKQAAALGTVNIVLALAIAFIIVFAIYSGLEEKEREAFQQIGLNPERAAILYALALIVFFVTYLISTTNQAMGSSFFSTALEAINIIALAMILFILVFFCSLFWTKDAIISWYSKQPHKKTQIYKQS